ncbi:cytochrome c oxidase subunit II [Nitrosococcus watsonii]|uniref:Cytochrome c oxidase subunit II n=1 Tax=Nitrosococcus watsoni (strain C-113) TaxID=105559 RepID=D8KC77_NITWC|nr:cytochrome c oxidase subunit II [Nitrosococcus watsonii]ADJ29748.1 cytochrome c oxidase subunit II [Nitrosococcus watsonii C-113]
MQSIASYITLLGTVLLLGVFYFVISNSKLREEYSTFSGKWYSFRGKWFIFLIILGTAFTLGTLIPFPIPPQAKTYSSDDYQQVDVSGHQWYWTMSTDTVVAGKPVEFRVVGADVNHGFGVYNENLELVAQVQAMPGYTNKLIHTFDEPGKYRIFCLEYCGLAHHVMMSELKVEAAS